MSKVRFYLSEMAVSDRHGGGLTIQRVLGHHLDDIREFLTVSAFARKLPPADRLKSRSANYYPGDEGLLDRITTNRRLMWYRGQPGGFIGSAVDRVRRNSVRKWLASRIEADPTAYWLLCPQSQRLPLLWNGGPVPLSNRYLTWMMDDHVLKYRGGAATYPNRYRIAFERHLKHAAHVFVISPAMQEFYRAEFGVESTVLFGGTQISPEATLSPTTNRVAGSPLRLGYFGALMDWQIHQLIRLAKLLLAAGATLDIYSAYTIPIELQKQAVRLHPAIPPESVMSTMAQYDAVVLPISADPALRSMTDLNIATKMSECLAADSLTLVIGPANAAMVRFLLANDAAVIVSGPNDGDLVSGIRQCGDADVRYRLRTNASRLVREQLTNERMRSHWERVVENLAN